MLLLLKQPKVRARQKLGAERRGVNPCDHLKGAGAASSLYSEKRSSQRGLQYDAGEPVNREEM